MKDFRLVGNFRKLGKISVQSRLNASYTDGIHRGDAHRLEWTSCLTISSVLPWEAGLVEEAGGISRLVQISLHV